MRFRASSELYNKRHERLASCPGDPYSILALGVSSRGWLNFCNSIGHEQSCMRRAVA